MTTFVGHYKTLNDHKTLIKSSKVLLSGEQSKVHSPCGHTGRVERGALTMEGVGEVGCNA